MHSWFAEHQRERRRPRSSWRARLAGAAVALVVLTLALLGGLKLVSSIGGA